MEGEACPDSFKLTVKEQRILDRMVDGRCVYAYSAACFSDGVCHAKCGRMPTTEQRKIEQLEMAPDPMQRNLKDVIDFHAALQKRTGAVRSE